jgi:predicted NUDIX family phosphoesterase
MVEQLVTIPRTILEEVCPEGVFHGVKPFSLSLLPLLDSKNFQIVPRNLAEEDPTYKQLVVYFTVQQNRKFLSYWRSPKGGDARLHRKFSFGFGGHVNEGDITPPRDPGLATVAREIKEEIDATIESVVFRGFLNDDSDPIGRVHLGLLYDVKVSNYAETGDDNIERPELVSWNTLHERYDDLEGWSKHVYDFIDKGLIRPRLIDTLLPEGRLSIGPDGIKGWNPPTDLKV